VNIISWDCSSNIFNSLKYSLHESLYLNVYVLKSLNNATIIQILTIQHQHDMFRPQTAILRCFEVSELLHCLDHPQVFWGIWTVTLFRRIKTPEDGHLWPKYVVLVLNAEYFNDCCITDGLNTWTFNKDVQQDAEIQIYLYI
jgi:hypothetical protein